VNLSFDCFRGFGRHLWFPTKEEALIVLNVKNLCCANFQSDLILGFFPERTDNFNINYNCNHYKGSNSNERSRTSQQTSFHSRSENTASFVSPDSGLNSWFKWTISVIVVAVLILIVVIFAVLSRESGDEVLPGQILNPGIEMVSVNRSNNTELPVSGDLISNDNSRRNSSLYFEFEPDLEEVQL
jgi:hypothetical protein